MRSKIIRWFETDHLPQHLAIVVQEMGEVARWLDEKLPEGAEKATALRKLLEAKDAAVRATIEAMRVPCPRHHVLCPTCSRCQTCGVCKGHGKIIRKPGR